MYLRTKTIGGKSYVYAVESHRVDGKPRQRCIAALGPLAGKGKRCSEPQTLPDGLRLPIHSPVRFALQIQGEWRSLKGLIVQIRRDLVGGCDLPVIRFPLLGEVREVQVPWSRLELLPSVLPLAGHSKDKSRKQTVLPL
jgi:hypothetical protein